MKLKAAAPWGNRILGTATKPASDFLANEANWRIHPIGQQDVLSSVLHDVGFVQSVVVNKRSSSAWGRDRNVETLVDGHLRVQLALSRGEDTLVPVVYVDLDPDEERMILATFDPVGALAATDQPKYDDLLGLLPEESAALARLAKGAQAAAKKLVQFQASSRHEVLVECADEGAQQALITRLSEEGYSCRAK